MCSAATGARLKRAAAWRRVEASDACVRRLPQHLHAVHVVYLPFLQSDLHKVSDEMKVTISLAFSKDISHCWELSGENLEFAALMCSVSQKRAQGKGCGRSLRGRQMRYSQHCVHQNTCSTEQQCCAEHIGGGPPAPPVPALVPARLIACLSVPRREAVATMGYMGVVAVA